MSLRYHEIAEANHRILNPFSHAKLMQLGEICRLQPGMTQLDLACGKGEMLCLWANAWGIRGTGVDISPVFLAAARRRAAELEVTDRVTLVEADAGPYLAQSDHPRADAETFDIVSCIGATWIGNGLTGSLNLMRPALKPGGLLLVGEPYWVDPPPAGAPEIVGFGKYDYASLLGTFERFEAAGCELVEMVLSDLDSWDRYEAAQWWTVEEWLRDNPHSTDATTIRGLRDESRRNYLTLLRRYFGWGVFVLRARD
ncbi:MAG: class I SAM-dependent methyltransferase [Litorilinea sp.]